jgi:hypothetical protein
MVVSSPFASARITALIRPSSKDYATGPELRSSYSVWLDPAVTKVEDLDHKALFEVHREATSKVIRKAMRSEPSIDWLLENQDKVEHYYHQQGVEGNL